MKLAVIGGGSTYTPELVDGIARLSADVAVEELVLVDPDETRLAVVGPFSDRLMRALGHPGRLTWTTSLDDGLDGAGDVQVVNLRNRGTLPFLDDDAVIEVPAVIGTAGAEAVPVAPLDPVMRGLVAHVSAYEELAVDAALRGGRHRVAGALLAHPLVGQYDLAGQLTDRLIAENAAYLPWAGQP